MITVRFVTPSSDISRPVHMRDVIYDTKHLAFAAMNDAFRGKEKATFEKATISKFPRLYVITVPAR